MSDSEDDMDDLIRMEEREREQQQQTLVQPPIPTPPHLPSSLSSPPSHPSSSSSFSSPSDLPLPSLEPAPDDYGGGGFIPVGSGDGSSEEKYPDSFPAPPSPSLTAKRKFASLADDDLDDADLAELDAHIASHTANPSLPPKAPAPPNSDVIACQDCGNLAYNVPYYKAFHLPLCNACQSLNPAQYSLITKSTARSGHLLTDADFVSLPFLLRPNPTKGSFANMKLYRLCEVRRVSDARWGGEAQVEEEKRRREKERMDREVDKRKRGRIEIDKERRVREYRHDVVDKGHRHAFVDVKKTGKQKCKECGFTLEYEEL